MQPYLKHTSIVALLDRANVDTDQIIPKQFLKKVERTGFGIHLFHDWRYYPDGSENIAFELNNPEFKGAKILLTGDNFGCGSSREHAPWALKDYGFNTIIATSFADIFYNNCFKNGILPIVVSHADSNELMDVVVNDPGTSFSIDLEKQQVVSLDGLQIDFDIDSFRKDNLLQGLDDIAITLNHVDKIATFEKQQKQQLPWLWS